MCSSNRFVHKKRRKKRKKRRGEDLCRQHWQNSLIPPLLHLTAQTCTVSKQWQIWNIQQPVLLLQHSKKKKKFHACSPCTLLILKTWWLLVQIGLPLHRSSACLWNRGCIFNKYLKKKNKKKSQGWGWNEREREKNEERERERERHWKAKWEQSAGECVKVYVCVWLRVCAADSSLAWQTPAGPEQSWAGSLLKALHLHSPGWHDALSTAGIARCLSHKGTIKELWYLAAPLSSGFPQLTVASVGGSPLLFLLL